MSRISCCWQRSPHSRSLSSCHRTHQAALHVEGLDIDTLLGLFQQQLLLLLGGDARNLDLALITRQASESAGGNPIEQVSDESSKDCAVMARSLARARM